MGFDFYYQIVGFAVGIYILIRQTRQVIRAKRDKTLKSNAYLRITVFYLFVIALTVFCGIKVADYFLPLQ